MSAATGVAIYTVVKVGGACACLLVHSQIDCSSKVLYRTFLLYLSQFTEQNNFFYPNSKMQQFPDQ